MKFTLDDDGPWMRLLEELLENAWKSLDQHYHALQGFRETNLCHHLHRELHLQ